MTLLYTYSVLIICRSTIYKVCFTVKKATIFVQAMLIWWVEILIQVTDSIRVLPWILNGTLFFYFCAANAFVLYRLVNAQTLSSVVTNTFKTIIDFYWHLPESNDFFGKKPLAEIVLIIEKGLSVSFSMPVAERVVIVATLATSHNKWPSICSFRQVLLSSGAKRRCKPSRRHHWSYLYHHQRSDAHITHFLFSSSNGHRGIDRGCSK